MTRRMQHGFARRGTKMAAEYRAWIDMRRRCSVPSCTAYEHYGARGITVCSDWATSFEAFIRDVGLRPSPAHSLDRIEVNGNYEPGNVRWATRVQQRNNMRVGHITWNGETKTTREWAGELGVRADTLSARIRRWGLARAMTTEKLCSGTKSGIENPAAKLTIDDVRRVREMKASQAKTAAHFGISKSLVGAIRRREVWAT